MNLRGLSKLASRRSDDPEPSLECPACGNATVRVEQGVPLTTPVEALCTECGTRALIGNFAARFGSPWDADPPQGVLHLLTCGEFVLGLITRNDRAVRALARPGGLSRRRLVMTLGSTFATSYAATALIAALVIMVQHAGLGSGLPARLSYWSALLPISPSNSLFPQFLGIAGTEEGALALAFFLLAAPSIVCNLGVQRENRRHALTWAATACLATPFAFVWATGTVIISVWSIAMPEAFLSWGILCTTLAGIVAYRIHSTPAPD
ncbi:MAG: hypothetical protein AABZ53_02135 [Planctomycetota bacterium]